MRVVAVLGLLSGIFNLAYASSPLSFNTSLPVPQGGLLLRVAGFHSKEQHEELGIAVIGFKKITRVSWETVYGVTPKLLVAGIFPYASNETRFSVGAKRESSGLGDILTVARYEVVAGNWPGRTARGALYSGVKWPSGSWRKKDGLGTLPTSVQVGDGAFDFLFGAVGSGQWLFCQMDADFSYRRRGPTSFVFGPLGAEELVSLRYGDILAQNTSIQYRLWPWALGKGVPRYLYAVLEANYTYQFKTRIGGVQNVATDGSILFLTYGLQWVTKRATFEFGVQKPVVQDPVGITTDYHLIGSIRFWF